MSQDTEVIRNRPTIADIDRDIIGTVSHFLALFP